MRHANDYPLSVAPNGLDMADDNDLVLDSERSAEDLDCDLRNALATLEWMPVALMDRMVSLGDYRSARTIHRGINRALNGK